MKRYFVFKQFFICNVFFIMIFTGIISCENHGFDSDKRQIMAKNEIQKKLTRAAHFDITGFHEDTVQIPSDPNLKKQIRYTLDFVYEDSNKVVQSKKGIVMFTPDGQSIISTNITSE